MNCGNNDQAIFAYINVCAFSNFHFSKKTILSLLSDFCNACLCTIIHIPYSI